MRKFRRSSGKHFVGFHSMVQIRFVFTVHAMSHSFAHAVFMFDSFAQLLIKIKKKNEKKAFCLKVDFGVDGG